MERQLLERMIGAGVLLVALVVIVPAILNGRPDVGGQSQSDPSGQSAEAPDAPLRQHTIRLDRQSDSPPVARQAAGDASAPMPTSAPATQTKSPTPEPQPKPAPTVAATEAKQPAPQPPKQTAKPAQPIPAPQPAAGRPAAVDAGWIVQLGSFSSRANAQGLADKTRARGFASYLMPIERSGRTLYRVRIGPPSKTRDEASKLADDLRKAGFKGQVAEQKAAG